MDVVVAWLKGTTLSQAIVTHIWVWPLCESLHFIGLALVIGIVGFFDLRLMGFMKRVPVGAIRDLMPLAILGFGLNLDDRRHVLHRHARAVRAQRRVVGEGVLSRRRGLSTPSPSS